MTPLNLLLFGLGCGVLGALAGVGVLILALSAFLRAALGGRRP